MNLERVSRTSRPCRLALCARSGGRNPASQLSAALVLQRLRRSTRSPCETRRRLRRTSPGRTRCPGGSPPVTRRAASRWRGPAAVRLAARSSRCDRRSPAGTGSGDAGSRGSRDSRRPGSTTVSSMAHGRQVEANPPGLETATGRRTRRTPREPPSGARTRAVRPPIVLPSSALPRPSALNSAMAATNDRWTRTVGGLSSGIAILVSSQPCLRTLNVRTTTLPCGEGWPEEA